MLKEHLAASGKRRSEWAQELRISEAFLSQIVNGKKRPSLDLAFRIERATDGAVPAGSWIEQPSAGEAA